LLAACALLITSQGSASVVSKRVSVTSALIALDIEARRCPAKAPFHHPGPIIAELELEAADIVTTTQLNETVKAAGVGTATRIVASRLRERGCSQLMWPHAPVAVGVLT